MDKENDKTPTATVRIGEWVLEEIDRRNESLPRKDRLSYREMLEEAWQIAQKAHKDQEDTPLVLDQTKKSVIKDITPVTISPVVPEGEPVVRTGETWYEHREIHSKLDRILRDGPPGMAADIKGNIDWFSVALDALGGRGDTADRVPGTSPTPPSGRTGGIERAREIIAEHRRNKSDPGGTGGRPGPGKKKTG